MSATTHRRDVLRAFFITKVFLSPTGLWFDATCAGKSRFSAFVTSVPALLITFALVSLCALVVTNIVLVTHPLPQFVFLVCVAVRQVSVLQKIVVLLRSRTRFREIFDECFDFGAVPEHVDEEYNVYLERCRKTPKTLIVLFVSIIAFYIPYWIFSNGSNSPIPIWLPLNFKEAYPIFSKFLFTILAVVLILVAAILLGFISFHVTLSTVCTTMLMHLDDVLSALAQPDRFLITLDDDEADAQDCAFYNEKVRETLTYAHNLHLKIIKWDSKILLCELYLTLDAIGLQIL